MIHFNRGFNDGFDLAIRTDAYDAFTEAREEIERELQELRRGAITAPLADLRNVFRAYMARADYYAGFLEGYWYARRGKPEPEYPAVYDE